MKTWAEEMEHEATKEYYDKLSYIIKDIITEVRPYSILEIGFGDGISAHAFLEIPDSHLVSVDAGDTSQKGFYYVEEYKKRFEYMPMTSDKFFSIDDRKFDIIYIDGDHTYEFTKRDADNAWDRLEDGGTIIGHDYLHRNNFSSDYGVTKAFNEFICEHKIEATIYPPHPGLIVIKK